MKAIIKYIKHILFPNLNKELHRNPECRGAERSALWPPAPPVAHLPSLLTPAPSLHTLAGTSPHIQTLPVPPANSHPWPSLRLQGTHWLQICPWKSGGELSKSLEGSRLWDDRKFQNPGSSRCGLEREVIGSGWALAHDFGGGE